MIIGQILLDGATHYERKSFAIDQLALSPTHGLTTDPTKADLVHIYGGPTLPRSLVRQLNVPWVASSAAPERRLNFGRHPSPSLVVSPLKGTAGSFLPEAVDDSFFLDESRDTLETPFIIGSLGRPAVISMIEQTLARVRRFRDDVEWDVFDRPPSAAELNRHALWVDPASDDNDFDGWVGEAVAAGVPVVATRTAINVQRLEKGRIGWLVPVRDANEMTHAILAALFKPEVARLKAEAARQTVSKFRSRQRLRILEQTYLDLVSHGTS